MIFNGFVKVPKWKIGKKNHCKNNNNGHLIQATEQSPIVTLAFFVCIDQPPGRLR